MICGDVAAFKTAPTCAKARFIAGPLRIEGVMSGRSVAALLLQDFTYGLGEGRLLTDSDPRSQAEIPASRTDAVILAIRRMLDQKREESSGLSERRRHRRKFPNSCAPQGSSKESRVVRLWRSAAKIHAPYLPITRCYVHHRVTRRYAHSSDRERPALR